MRAAVSLLTAILLVSSGCGGGDGGGGAAAAPCLSFVGLQAPAAGRVVARLAAGGSCAARAVELVVTDVSDVFGAQFVLTFDATKVSYAGASSQGSFLTSGGAQVSVQEGGGGGSVSVGISRIGVSTGVNVTGSQVLIRLNFAPVAAGASTLSLGSAILFGSQTPPQPKPGLTWSGGSFTIQ
ncbi:MAG TPA: hypothetical protein VFV75_08995 [Candidatus Polarisedimenticolaceae bacterium]|nr:hypothetical protein [Candidatus Polarisedimenticolaceae bacterium]